MSPLGALLRRVGWSLRRRARNGAAQARSTAADVAQRVRAIRSPAPPDPIGFCPLCRSDVLSWEGGPAGSTSARCPHCGSLPRQRHLAILIDRIEPVLHGTGPALEYAPTKLLRRFLVDRIGERYLSLDLALHRDVEVLGDAVHLPFRDESIGLAVSFHILEHIPDDAAAIREMHRVVIPGGLALVQCPYRAGHPTDEDPDASPEERTRRFGLPEHVRLYGDDFTERLARPGFHVTLLRAGDYLGQESCERHAIPLASPIWLCRRRIT